MRGKASLSLFFVVVRGITPAYAGKSYAQRNFAHNSWDHPRVCGEKPDHAPGLSRLAGSPPRMRGKEWLWLS